MLCLCCQKKKKERWDYAVIHALATLLKVLSEARHCSFKWDKPAVRRSVDTSYITEKTADVWPSLWSHLSWQWPVSLSLLPPYGPVEKGTAYPSVCGWTDWQWGSLCPGRHHLRLMRVGQVRLQPVLMWRELCPGLTFLTPLINSLKYSCSHWWKVAQSRLYFTFMSERERHFDSFFPAVFCRLLAISSNILKGTFLRHWKLQIYPTWSQFFVLKNLSPKARNQSSWFYSIYSLMYVPFSLFWKHDVVCTCTISFLQTCQPSEMDKVQNHAVNFVTTNTEQ